MVGGLTPRARPAHMGQPPHSGCHGHTHLHGTIPFCTSNTYRERLSIKGLWGRVGGGLFKAKSVPARGWAGLTHLQPTPACPGLLGAGGDGWGVGKDSWRAGRHKCQVLGDRKPVTVATATMSCVYCVDIWRREGSVPRMWGCRAWVQPALALNEACAERTTCAEWVAGRLSGCP